MHRMDMHANTVVADPRWASIVARDPAADGTFWYSVATTGVYCRPSCPSRRCNPANVALHDTLESARATGFRACRRCRPDDPSAASVRADLVTRACRLIENSEVPPSLGDLANALHVSPGHLHRVFKAGTGLTPKAYADGCKARRMREALAGDGNITASIYKAGYASTGRFYAASHGVLGMTPSRVRNGGATETIRFAVGETTLGSILVASSGKGIAAILIGDDPDMLARDLQDRFPRAEIVGADADYEATIARVVSFVEAPRIGFDLPMDVRGTAFQQRVWQALRAIPAGQTLSYAELAERIGAPSAVRAVAGACAANSLAIAIPCHRVVRTDGSLSGYAWGVERKRAILDRERLA